MRSSTADVAKRLNATVRMSLEESLEFISDDELVEVTPLNLRLRKMDLSAHDANANVATEPAPSLGRVYIQTRRRHNTAGQTPPM